MRSPLFHCFALLLVLVGVLARAKTAAAEEHPLIARVRSPNTALDMRLDAELESLGFVVRLVEPGEPPADLEAMTRASGAVAGIRVGPEEVVELWILPHNEGEPPVHETVRLDARRGWNVAAVAAIEALRAHLLEIRSPPLTAPPPAAPALVAAPPPPPSPPRRPRLWVHLGAGVDASPGGLAPAFDALLELRIEPVPWLSIAAFGAGTPLALSLEAPEGKASVRHGFGGLAFDAQKHLGRVSLAVGAGATFVWSRVEGSNAAPGFGARDSEALTLAPILRASVSLALTMAVRLRLAALAGATFPETTIAFADREIATWGRPFGLLSFGIELGAIR